MAHDQEVVGSNPGTVYWMDVCDLLAISLKKIENKGSQMGRPKKIFFTKSYHFSFLYTLHQQFSTWVMFTLGVQFTGVCTKFKNNSKVPDLGVILFEGCSIGVQFGFGGTQVLKVLHTTFFL